MACCLISSSLKLGPKCRGFLGLRAPCEGGRNLSGCSRTRNRDSVGGLVEALRRAERQRGVWGLAAWRDDLRARGYARRGRDIVDGVDGAC